MLGLLVIAVFVVAGCTGAAVVATSVRQALPAMRRLSREREALAQDRVYLYTLIETPRHDGTPAPVVPSGQRQPVCITNATFNAPRRRAMGDAVPLRVAA